MLSSLRQKVERAIGLLKGGWRKLLFLDHLDLKLSVHLVISACVLHNVCLLNDDYYECCMDDEDNNDHPVDEPHCYDESRAEENTPNEHCLSMKFSLSSQYTCVTL